MAAHKVQLKAAVYAPPLEMREQVREAGQESRNLCANAMLSSDMLV